MRNPNSKKGLLEVDGGKWAKIESIKISSKVTHQIVAKHVQGDKPMVTVYQETGETSCVNMAFCFELQKKKYFPVVKRQGDTAAEQSVQFGVESLNEPDKKRFDKTFLFTWNKGNGVWKTLRSVAEPSLYLSVSTHNQFTLTTTPQTHFRINYIGNRRSSRRPKQFPRTRCLNQQVKALPM